MRRILPLALVALFVLTGGKCGKPHKPPKATAEEAVAQALESVDLDGELEAHGALGVLVPLDDAGGAEDWVIVYFQRDAAGRPEARVDLDGERFVVPLPP